MMDDWNIETLKNNFPYSERVNIPALQRVFSSTAASYKYLYFLSLLDLLQQTGFNRLYFSFDEILLEMLANAWYPHHYFKLNFGVNDRIAQELDRLGISDLEVRKICSSKAGLKKQIKVLDYRNNSLMDMVPYRLLTPFFSEELRREAKDHGKNRRIVELAERDFESARPFYLLSSDGKGFIMHQQWMAYFFENQQLVRSFICWNWLDYMERRNPSVPNLQKKLFPPDSRNSLSTQTKFWRKVLQRAPLQCIFSGEPIGLDDLSLDHFLPWSFVAHDQLWNLIPVSKSINSSKSNRLPSLDLYLPKMVDLQYQGLKSYHNHQGQANWRKICQPYVQDLHLRQDELLNRELLGRAYRNVMEPLNSLAAAQGFEEGWVLE